MKKYDEFNEAINTKKIKNVIGGVHRSTKKLLGAVSAFNLNDMLIKLQDNIDKRRYEKLKKLNRELMKFERINHYLGMKRISLELKSLSIEYLKKPSSDEERELLTQYKKYAIDTLHTLMINHNF